MRRIRFRSKPIRLCKIVQKCVWFRLGLPPVTRIHLEFCKRTDRVMFDNSISCLPKFTDVIDPELLLVHICCEARLLTTHLHRTHSFEMETATHWIYCDSHYFIKRRCDDRRWRCIECENCKWFWHFLTELNKWPGRTFICAMRWLPAPQWPHHWWSIARNCEINVNRNCSIKFQFRDSIAYSMPLYGDHCYLFTFVSSTRFQCKEV